MEELSSVAEVIWIVIWKKDGRGILARGEGLVGMCVAFGSALSTSFCYLFIYFFIF